MAVRGRGERIGAVIVAAGLSSRMEAFKPLLPFEESTISMHIVETLKKSGADPILVVTGYRAEELEAHLAATGAHFLRNERYRETQMFDSVKLGIEAIAGQCDRIILMPVDTPAITLKTIKRALAVDADMVRTFYGGEPGHPIILKSAVAMELCSYQGERGLRGAMEHSPRSITNVNVRDKGVNWDVDTREQYQALIGWNYRRWKGIPLHPHANGFLKTLHAWQAYARS